MSSPKEPAQKQVYISYMVDTDSESSASSILQPLSKQELCAALAKCHPPKVAKSLISGLENATAEQVGAVQSLLAPLLATTLEPLHCVRCHRKYFESENTNSSCKIEHDEPEDEGILVYEGHNKKRMHRYPCCDESFPLDSDSEPTSTICYTDWHTTDPEDVEYERNKTVQTCEEAGCIIESD
ncbi:hypothetical protein FRC08_015096 [Ceratobasidium sp. 394]|nr:hypothetical protein FRC08_015096 [Ceratobasidium sp. 394]